MTTLNKILCVEDDPDIQIVARMALQNIGKLEVEICASGQAALQRAPVYMPDLILLDVMMPGMDGPTTFNALRGNALTAHIPVIFMTAKVQAHEVSKYIAMGALDVISKPFDPMTLANTVRAVWARVGT